MTDPLLTRRDLADWLTSQGFPISYSYLKNKCAPSINKGPPVALIWGGRSMYDRWAGLAWAETQCRKSGQPPGQPRDDQPEKTECDQKEPEKTYVIGGCESGCDLK